MTPEERRQRAQQLRNDILPELRRELQLAQAEERYLRLLDMYDIEEDES